MINVVLMFQIAAVILSISATVALIRLIIGPTTPDRVVGMDIMTITTMSIFILLGAIMDEVIYIDVAIVYGLLSFVATLYIAKYLEGDAR